MKIKLFLVGGFMKKRLVLLYIAVIGIIIVIKYIHFQNNPIIAVRVEISGIDDETYDSIGRLDYVKHPKKGNFKELELSGDVYYSKNIEEVQFSMPDSFIDLLGKDIYWNGGGWEDASISKRYSQYYSKAIIYVGEVTEAEIKNKLNKGYFNVYWYIDGEEKKKEYNIGESLRFVK